MRQPGAVFDYPYLWSNEAGKVDNPKDRVTCLVVARTRADREGVDLHHLLLAGITDNPRPDQEAVEIPVTEKRRAGLQLERPAFVVLSEYNYDVLPHSWNYDPNGRTFGRFSDAFMDEVRRRFFTLMKAGMTARNDRMAPGR
ncbi:hypothetical protein AO398_00360 [Methylobacterium sp. GXS13]|uniref:hypothetical protein n=1 Tax=Methylobacterium sp. GXS13 TaxID=1730094 RepID=UPI00071B2472|nr:hypothetical protein [Methylobacterium sp. GXS13]KST61177.1 hypothetical protein AO398_00360 [Methylobacterium sp. GXS13]